MDQNRADAGARRCSEALSDVPDRMPTLRTPVLICQTNTNTGERLTCNHHTSPGKHHASCVISASGRGAVASCNCGLRHLRTSACILIGQSIRDSARDLSGAPMEAPKHVTPSSRLLNGLLSVSEFAEGWPVNTMHALAMSLPHYLRPVFCLSYSLTWAPRLAGQWSARKVSA